MADNFGFQKLLTGLQQMKAKVPVLLANEAQNYFVRSFTQQGWDGQRWQEVKRREPGTQEYKYPKSKGLSRRTSPILVRTGRLRRAVSNSIRSATWQSVRLVVDLKYAAAQNDGNPDRNLPRRHYMGNSPILEQKQMQVLRSYTSKLFKIH